MAIDSSNPENVIVSASKDFKSHYIDSAESVLYRLSIKDDNGDDNGNGNIGKREWILVTKGICESKGTIISNLAVNPKIKGEFYCLNNRGIYHCVDSGVSWSPLDISWPKEYLVQHPRGIAVKE